MSPGDSQSVVPGPATGSITRPSGPAQTCEMGIRAWGQQPCWNKPTRWFRSMLKLQDHSPKVWCSPLHRSIFAHVYISTGTATAGFSVSCLRVCATTGSKDVKRVPHSTPLRFDWEGQEIHFLSPSLADSFWHQEIPELEGRVVTWQQRDLGSDLSSST